MVHNIINLSTEAVVNLYAGQKVKITPAVVSECVEKYLMTRLYDSIFTANKDSLKSDGLLFEKIDQASEIYQTLSPRHSCRLCR